MTALPTMRREGYYIAVLVVLALAGQLFASYDFNLLVLTIPNITKTLHMSSTQVGALVFFIYGGEFLVTVFAGYAMDRFGRKLIWQANLVGTAVFTGLTYFVANYAELVIIRTIAGAFAVAEFAMAAVLVSEQTPARLAASCTRWSTAATPWGSCSPPRCTRWSSGSAGGRCSPSGSSRSSS
jgi:MFS family permease